jgi:hypothetical protein
MSLDRAFIAERETATLWLDLSQIQVFDPATGENLSLNHEQ